MHLTILATALASSMAKIAEFYDKGGIIMYALTFCSILTLAVIIFKALSLSRKKVLPNGMQQTINHFVQNSNDTAAEQLALEASKGESVLARLSQTVVNRSQSSGQKIRDAVQAKAHEEIVKLQGGIQVLDVVIVVSPLLGLLGTASGITTVFDGLSSLEDVKMNIMAAGVAEALSTTIAGLAVAVPAVIGHSFFNRKIETYASQLEVTCDDLVNAVTERQDKAA
ncbi:MotA/TolQ/ExbB proton channel family protein [Rubritalea spongiae]|uniref:MotA/TolQ/ExbB proton channel family protein n=1 Tax=Rubritalea spongiae TaxID=430797 RepID=A0ABW5E523_9BACT